MGLVPAVSEANHRIVFFGREDGRPGGDPSSRPKNTMKAEAIAASARLTITRLHSRKLPLPGVDENEVREVDEAEEVNPPNPPVFSFQLPIVFSFRMPITRRELIGGRG